MEKNLIYMFGIPHALIIDNGKQFDNNSFRSFCLEFGINLMFVRPAHLKANGQVEVANKVIKKALKKRLDDHKEA